MTEALDSLIQDLDNKQSPLYRQLSSAIPQILSFKHKLYTKQLVDLNTRIINVEQPKTINSLCSQNLTKDTIEYQDTRNQHFMSYNTESGILVDLTAGTESNMRNKVLSTADGIPADKLALLDVNTQCQALPRSLVARIPAKAKGSAGEMITPSWENIKAQNASYFEQVAARSKLNGFLQFIQTSYSQLDNKITVPDPNKRVRSRGAPTTLTLTQLEYRLLSLKISLEDLKNNILGESRREIRDKIADFVLSFANNWRLYTGQYLNIALLGPPGSGKTTVARYIGQVFKNLGILVLGQVSEQSRATIVGQYIGQTADKVRNILVDNLESVVFIDEAYAIAQGGNKGEYDPYGVEALNEIVGFLDKHRGQICIIAAGYQKEMEEYWFGPNPGLRRRTPYVWELRNYSSKELFEIMKHAANTEAYNNAVLNGNSSTLLVSNQVGSYIKFILDYYNDPSKGGFFFINQAGDMETLVSTIANQYFLSGKRLDLEDIEKIFENFLDDRLQGSVHIQGSTSPEKIATKLDELKQEAKKVKIMVNYSNEPLQQIPPRIEPVSRQEEEVPEESMENLAISAPVRRTTRRR